MHIEKSQGIWESLLCIGEKKNGIFLTSHISSAFYRLINKASKDIAFHDGEGLVVLNCFSVSGTAASNLRKVQRILKTINPFWSEMCCQVSESSVSVAGYVSAKG